MDPGSDRWPLKATTSFLDAASSDTGQMQSVSDGKRNEVGQMDKTGQEMYLGEKWYYEDLKATISAWML